MFDIPASGKKKAEEAPARPAAVPDPVAAVAAAQKMPRQEAAPQPAAEKTTIGTPTPLAARISRRRTATTGRPPISMLEESKERTPPASMKSCRRTAAAWWRCSRASACRRNCRHQPRPHRDALRAAARALA